jgi:hypothetical protein
MLGTDVSKMARFWGPFQLGTGKVRLNVPITSDIRHSTGILLARDQTFPAKLSERHDWTSKGKPLICEL